jgi:hypothetical protein
MPKTFFSLEQQLSDLRSNEMAYILKIENQGSKSINLFSITPRISDKVELVEVKNPSLSAARAQSDELCKQLTELLKDDLNLQSAEFRQKRVQIEVEIFREVFGSIPKLFGLYLSVFTGSFKRRIEGRVLRTKALFPELSNMTDAVSAYKRFIEPKPESDVIRNVFAAKIEQLSILDKALGAANSPSSALATIEPDSSFAVTYVLRFPRSVANPRKYNVTVEGTYSEMDDDKRHVGSASTSLLVSPRPEVLTVIAMLAALLGVILKTAIAASSTSAQTTLYTALYGAMWPGGVSAVIMSLVFFNVYEFTSLADNFRMAVGWRSALLIGLLCGLAGDRIVAALRAFVGSH